MKSSFLIILSLLFTVSAFSQSWSWTGNAGTTNSNFVGTTDDQPLIFKVNNKWAGFSGAQDRFNVSFGYLSFGNSNPLTGGHSNTAFGAQTLQYNNAGIGNVAIGHWALLYNNSNYNVAIGLGAMSGLVTGDDNVAIGKHALSSNRKSQNTVVGSEAAQFNTDGEGLTAVGFKTLNKNTTGEFNTALGYQALLLNTTGFWNVALGSGSLQNNLTGRFNTAGGNSSLHFNQAGVENTGFGEQALGGNINGSYNTAVGCRSLHSVLFTPGSGDSGFGNGDANTTVGYESMKNMTTGSWNAGLGVRALFNNSTGSENTGIGNYALVSNTTGGENVAVGTNALYTNTTGSKNTAIGYFADVNSENLNNATAIGYGALATASNQVVIGNSNVNSIKVYIQGTTISDKRIKKNVKTNVPGLTFINKLQPVTYNLDLDAADQIIGKARGKESNLTKEARARQQKRTFSGFLAQDVEKAAQGVGYDFSGVDPAENNSDLYGLRYSAFIVPLVKAVQELSAQKNERDLLIASMQERIDRLEKTLEAMLNTYLKEHVDDLTDYVDYLAKRINDLHPSISGVNSVQTPNGSLGQNYPNPFNQSTTISYSLPHNSSSAKIIITDASGRVFKNIFLEGQETGKVTIEAGTLPAGVYFYSLYVDNNLIDAKKMILTKF
jgi:hypothetical protein